MSNNPADGLYLRIRTKNIPTGMLTEAELELLYEGYQVTDLRTARNKVILSLLVNQAGTTDDIGRIEPVHLLLRGEDPDPGEPS